MTATFQLTPTHFAAILLSCEAAHRKTSDQIFISSYPDRKLTTLWTIPSGGQDADTVHSTQKPVECMRRPILNKRIGLRALPRERHYP